MKRILILLMAVVATAAMSAQRTERTLETGWKFHLGDVANGQALTLNDADWQNVRIPHDWAISGKFDRKNDLQVVAVEQNGETEATEKTGRTGGLPLVGVGWYRTEFEADPARKAFLIFDGAMAEPHVYVNGREVAFRPYGYSTFYVDITSALSPSGKNLLAVRLENRDQSARWYSGAGLYRNVRLLQIDKVYFEPWQTRIMSPDVDARKAFGQVDGTVRGAHEENVKIVAEIFDETGKKVFAGDTISQFPDGSKFCLYFNVENPHLWSPEHPTLYRLETRLYADGKLVDAETTKFGFRSLEFIPTQGFFLNGQPRKVQGVCVHHDLGPLGAALNRSAVLHRLQLLKDMGCDGIRTSHNFPSPELLEMCDSMGFLVMAESFDEWIQPKCDNGYHRFFDEYAERDMTDAVCRFRNHPSIIYWSIGNEVPEQCMADGWKPARLLANACHRADPTRPVTCGVDKPDCAMGTDFAKYLDVPGLNYRVHFYALAYDKHPLHLVLGSETASTVSSRGVYKFPATPAKHKMHADNQSSGYDVECCWWSNLPDYDFALADDYPWTLGQYVWTGFDYLGEPTPYDTDDWPSHSSLFGIFDLASLPKDRFYLYRSVWNRRDHTLHVLPHWTWTGREGQATPVFVYTDLPEAELFVNGRSMGRKHKAAAPQNAPLRNSEEEFGNVLERYRLMWHDVPYEAGEIRAVAYDAQGNKVMEQTVKTAGAPHHLTLEKASAADVQANGKDVAFYTVSMRDKDGNLCPFDASLVKFDVSGAGRFKGAANGDATCLDSFVEPQMHLFSGQCTVLVEASDRAGRITLKASAPGVKAAKATLRTH